MIKIELCETISELRVKIGLEKEGLVKSDNILGGSIDDIYFDTEFHYRARRDCEVLSTIGANSKGKILEIGTSMGNSAFHLAHNSFPNEVMTVNALPEQIDLSVGLPTYAPDKDSIGKVFRDYGLTNVTQIYENSQNWEIPAYIDNLGSIFIDGDHSIEAVYRDSKSLFPRLSTGGIIAWHDFSPHLRSRFHWIDESMTGVELFLREIPGDHTIYWLRNSWIGVYVKNADNIQRLEDLRAKKEKSVVQVIEPGQSGATREDILAKMKKLKYVYAYSAYEQKCITNEEPFLNDLRMQGYDIIAFPLLCPGGWWHFPKLDMKWKSRDPELMMLYDRLSEVMSSRHVLVAPSGAMLHPEFISGLSSYNVFQCADDPESTEILSKPVASAFDYCLPLNVACLDMYRSWGIKNLGWAFHGIDPYDPKYPKSYDKVKTESRALDIVMLCERVYDISNRANRVEYLMSHFPQALVRGKGWPGGFIEHDPFPQAKIGWNLHNSTGPVNSRVVTLMAYGVTQICDNKNNLGKMFELDKEVIGFDTLDECVEKTRYYLAHEEEAREIAANGWRRVMKDYTLLKQWEQVLLQIYEDYKTKHGAI